MKTRKSYMMLILLLACVNIYTQNSDKSKEPGFGFNVGISHFQVKERNINGLVHRGPGFNAAAVYTQSSTNALQRFELMGEINFLKSKFDSETGTYLIRSSINYRYNRHVATFNGGIDLFLGGTASLDASQGIFESWDVNHFYWLTSYSLGFTGTIRYKLSERNAITLDFGTPLLSVISRTPSRQLYHEDNPEFTYVVEKIHENPSLESWPNHLSLELKLAYHLKVKEKSSRTLFWKFNYVNNNVSNSNQFRFITHAFGIEFLF